MTSDSFYVIFGILALLMFGWVLFIAGPRAFARAGHSRWWALVLVVPLVNFLALAKLWDDADYSGWYLLLVFVPFGGCGMILMLAYATEWPVERQTRMERIDLEARRIPTTG